MVKAMLDDATYYHLLFFLFDRVRWAGMLLAIDLIIEGILGEREFPWFPKRQYRYQVYVGIWSISFYLAL